MWSPKIKEASQLSKRLFIGLAILISLSLSSASIATANETFDNVLQQADAGNIKAQYTAGYVYHMGQKEFPNAKVKYNPVKAYTWYLICLKNTPPGSSLSKVTRLYMTVLKPEMSQKQLTKAQTQANKWHAKTPAISK